MTLKPKPKSKDIGLSNLELKENYLINFYVLFYTDWFLFEQKII